MQQWHYQQVTGIFDEETSGGCRHLSTWRRNPQYHLWVKEDTHCVVIMHQDAAADEEEEEELMTMGLYVAKTSQMKRQKLTLWKEDIMCKSRFDMTPTIDVHVELPASETPYVLIPATYDIGEYGRFTIRVYSDKQVKMAPVVGDPDWTSQTVQGEWTEETAGGSRSHSSWRLNDQYQLEITEPTTIIPVITIL